MTILFLGYIKQAGWIEYQSLPACGVFLEKSFRVPKIKSYQFIEKTHFSEVWSLIYQKCHVIIQTIISFYIV